MNTRKKLSFRAGLKKVVPEKPPSPPASEVEKSTKASPSLETSKDAPETEAPSQFRDNKIRAVQRPKSPNVRSVVKKEETRKVQQPSESDFEKSQTGSNKSSRNKQSSDLGLPKPSAETRVKKGLTRKVKASANRKEDSSSSSISSTITVSNEKQKILHKNRTRTRNHSPEHPTQTSSTIKSADGDSQEEDCQTANSVIQLRSDELAVRFRNFALHCQSLQLEQFKAEFAALPTPDMEECRAFFDKKNIPLNRYHNIWCLDISRVVVRFGDSPSYIHANKVAYPSLKSPFIITQGPLKRTVPDFWRMIWQESVTSIIMLCKIVENGKKKCAEYIPSRENAPMSQRSLSITLKRQRQEGGLITSMLEIAYEGTIRQVTHYQWPHWPDCRAVNDSKMMSTLLRKVRESKTPVVVHCSAGIGRSGTLVALEMCIRDIITERPINVNDVVKSLRNYRCMAVQTLDQYLSLYKFVLQFGEDNGFIQQDDAENFYRTLDEYALSANCE